MKYKIVAFGGSNSKNSINKKLATYTAYRVENGEVQILDLNDFLMPIYSIDIEKESGLPQFAHDFKEHLRNADGLVISLAEHNGAYSVAFKNIYDWISRIDSDVWMGKPMFLLATSPGGRGGQTVLDIAVKSLGRQNKNMVSCFSLPSFGSNFSEEKGITDPDLLMTFNEQLLLFENLIEELNGVIAE